MEKFSCAEQLIEVDTSQFIVVALVQLDCFYNVLAWSSEGCGKWPCVGLPILMYLLCCISFIILSSSSVLCDL